MQIVTKLVFSFPQQASAEDKLLIIVLGLMIDYQYFESSSNDTNKRGRRRNAYYGYY